MSDHITIKTPERYLYLSCEWFSVDFHVRPPDGWQCPECEKRDAERRAAWVAFCAACIAGDGGYDPRVVADDFLAEYDARFPKRRK